MPNPILYVRWESSDAYPEHEREVTDIKLGADFGDIMGYLSGYLLGLSQAGVVAEGIFIKNKEQLTEQQLIDMAGIMASAARLSTGTLTIEHRLMYYVEATQSIHIAGSKVH